MQTTPAPSCLYDHRHSEAKQIPKNYYNYTSKYNYYMITYMLIFTIWSTEEGDLSVPIATQEEVMGTLLTLLTTDVIGPAPQRGNGTERKERGGEERGGNGRANRKQIRGETGGEEGMRGTLRMGR